MKTVILFGGGDAGGFIITDRGVRPIPPFDPAILLNLKATSAMVKAASAAHGDDVRSKISKAATGLCNLALEQVEEVVGPLEGNNSLIFQDDDGGFYCGSTGRPPVPLPWPPPTIPSVQDYLSAGVVEPDLVTLFRTARAKEIPLAGVFEKPAQVAKELGLTLSDKSVKDLQGLAPSKLTAIKDPVEREIVGFFQKVAEDGRYLESWFSRPYEVSKELKVKLSEAAAERLLTGGASGGPASDDAGGAQLAIAAIGWAGVCIAVGTVTAAAYQYGEIARPIETFVVDRSRATKI